MKIRPFSTTGIGSLPHREASAAVDLILDTFDIPFWPQLPHLSYKEGMVAQYSEGMPFLKVDDERGRVHVEPDDGEQLERFYESYTEDTKIAISEEYAKGLHTFLKIIKGRRFPALKGHVTGPLTFALGLNDSDGRAVYFNEELREISLMLLKAKIRWQVDVLSEHSDNVIIFIDEPILSALGSTTYMGVSRDEALRLLRETVSAVKNSGAIPGIHCCGRTEWPLVIESGVSILNFDAYEYAETLTIYPEELKVFLNGGGILAWGIVPTTDAINKETPESMNALFQKKLEALSRHIPADLLRNNIILTPSCGTGSMTIPEAIKVFQLLIRLKEDVS